jgi:DNA-binding transcriptional MerR regulator
VTSKLISIGTLARLSGVTAHTLRYYEKLGVLQAAGRAPNGHRRYHAGDLAWLAFVLRLKATGMPLTQIRHYAALRAAGDDTLLARLDLLVTHREQLVARIAALSDNLLALDDKVVVYQARIAQVARQDVPCTTQTIPRKKRLTS